MNSARWLAAVFVFCSVVDTHAQIPKTTWQFHALGTSADAEFLGAGLGLGYRPGGRLMYQAALTPGISAGAFVVRSEGLLVFSLNPAARDGVSPYGGGGVAVTFAESTTRAFFVVLVGLEAAPQARSGWFAELGVGGGVRAAVGWRLRR